MKKNALMIILVLSSIFSNVANARLDSIPTLLMTSYSMDMDSVIDIGIPLESNDQELGNYLFKKFNAVFEKQHEKELMLVYQVKEKFIVVSIKKLTIHSVAPTVLVAIMNEIPKKASIIKEQLLFRVRVEKEMIYADKINISKNQMEDLLKFLIILTV